ncbi:MAG: DUF2007 domain-containing protein [Gloeobacteraceae cyanobacterium ES-bin-144]|nr:DUF2007 domain-containing protein [Verrucomicrobiales bacterium]
MITIASFTQVEDAHLLRAYLESRGIEAFVYDEYIAQLFWCYSNAIGGVRVVVAEEDEDQAKSEYLGYMEALRAGPYPERPVRMWGAVFLVSLWLGLPLLLFGRRAARNENPK